MRLSTQGCEPCPGGNLEPVPGATGSTRAWWQCPTCRWIGWSARAGKPPKPINPTHQRPIPLTEKEHT